MSDAYKLLTHPNKDEIIAKLVNGEKPKEVNEWLRLLYDKPDHKHLILSHEYLKNFLAKHMNMYEQLEKDLEDNKKNLLNKEISDSILKNKTYKERLHEFVDKEIDVKKTINNTVYLIQSRLEQVFDSIQDNPSEMKNDQVLLKLFDTFMNSLERYDKIVNNRPDTIIQQNITVQQIDSQVVIFQECLREVLEEMDPQFASLFMEKLSDKMQKLKAPEQEKPMTTAMRNNEIRALTNISSSIEEI